MKHQQILLTKTKSSIRIPWRSTSTIKKHIRSRSSLVCNLDTQNSSSKKLEHLQKPSLAWGSIREVPRLQNETQRNQHSIIEKHESCQKSPLEKQVDFYSSKQASILRRGSFFFYIGFFGGVQILWRIMQKNSTSTQRTKRASTKTF